MTDLNKKKILKLLIIIGVYYEMSKILNKHETEIAILKKEISELKSKGV